MAKKSKMRGGKPTAPAAALEAAGKKPAAAGKRAARKKPAAGALSLTLPLARARKLAGDLYQAAGHGIWAEALDKATSESREQLIHLQDAICDAGDILREAKAGNPKHLGLYMVACYDRDGLPATPPRFVTAASADKALEIWKAAFAGEYGRRKPRAEKVPERGEAPGLHE